MTPQEIRSTLRLLLLLISCVVTSTVSTNINAGNTIHHTLKIALDPATSMITAQDTITLPDDLASQEYFEFLLHKALNPASATHTIEAVTTPDNSIQHRYRLKLGPDNLPITLKYRGVINHPISATGEQYARGFKETQGLIDAEGIFLTGSTLWYPVVPNQLVSFELEITLPAGWSAISQGVRSNDHGTGGQQSVQWTENQPQDDIFLIANRYHEYSQSTGTTEAMVFLRDDDEALAQKYLDTTAQYLAMYNKLLGPYPYKKFAMVENFWDTGYGMPSFTLLGPRVIRFPFILHSSYPHEILHNWWGNAVFVDYDKGNWAEGLTTYLADHLIAEQRGKAIAYRRDVLQRYSDFVNEERDFPLSQFRTRHSSATEAVGYGKTLMLFHMLRQQLGNRDFIRALATLYRKYRFKVTSFQDVEAVFSQVSDQDLSGFFEQWVQRSGAPSLKLTHATVTSQTKQYHLNATLVQQQLDEPFQLQVPVVVYLESQDDPHVEMVSMTSQQTDISITFDTRPLRIEIDPMFDLFRRLDDKEIPAALSQGFGAERVLMLLPSKADKRVLNEYRAMAEMWQQSQPGVWQVKLDSEIDTLPSDRAVWILGWENRFSNSVKKALKEQDVTLTGNTLNIKEKSFSITNHSAMLTARHPQNSSSTLVWLAASRAEAVPALTRKLPHYRKYSYLAFEGDEGNNVAKGQWHVLNSPMSLNFNYADDLRSDESMRDNFKLTPAPALAQLPPLFSKKRMMADLSFLASEAMQGRGLGTVELERAADYIANEFKKAGLKPGGNNNSYFQQWHEDVGPPLGETELTNVIAILPGSNPELEGESLIISAHYDHLGLGWPDVHQGDEGKIHFGADDNASGVAVMLELARQISKRWNPARTIVFVAFTGEEAGLLGSQHYTHAMSRLPAHKAIAVLNLDTVGRVGDGPVTVFGTQSARELIHIIRGAGFVTGIQTQSVNTDIGFSDQKSFYDIGIPGVQFFGSVHSDFHRPGDNIKQIDSAGMIKVAAILKETAEYLANVPQGLDVTLPKSAAQKHTQRVRIGRRVSVGTIPDFAFSGNGVRITGTKPESPAAQAGLKEGDILTAINGKSIEDLAAYAKVLRSLKAGDTITLQYQRDDKSHQVEITTVAR